MPVLQGEGLRCGWSRLQVAVLERSIGLWLKPLAVLLLTIAAAATSCLLLSSSPFRYHQQPPLLHHRMSSTASASASSRRSFILWLHGLGDSGPANEPIKAFFSSPHFTNTSWSFPSAPPNPVSCNYGAIMPSWFDIYEIPVTAESPKDEAGVLKAVENVHAIIDKEIASGTSPDNVFVCGFSQGGALTLASVLLYPKNLGGGAVFSGWVPFNSSILGRITPEANKTPILWSHGMVDHTVLFEAGQAGPPFLQQMGMSYEFKAYPDLSHSISSDELRFLELWLKQHMRSSS